MKTAIPKPSKQSIIREARDYVMIAIGMILYGIGWTVFLLPNDITTGGVPGIASIVYWATGFPVQYTYFSINFFLLLLALKLLGMKFCIKTIFGVFTLTFFLSVIISDGRWIVNLKTKIGLQLFSFKQNSRYEDETQKTVKTV